MPARTTVTQRFCVLCWGRDERVWGRRQDSRVVLDGAVTLLLSSREGEVGLKDTCVSVRWTRRELAMADFPCQLAGPWGTQLFGQTLF